MSDLRNINLSCNASDLHEKETSANCYLTEQGFLVRLTRIMSHNFLK